MYLSSQQTERTSVNVELVLQRIQYNLRAVARLINQGNYPSALNKLRSSLTNLNRIRPMLSAHYDDIENCILELVVICNNGRTGVMEESLSFEARRIVNARGRPTVVIDLEQLKVFLAENYTASAIAKHFNCSVSLVYKRMYGAGLHFKDRYTIINDNDLLRAVDTIRSTFPNSGSEMMRGYLRGRGINVQRARVRKILSVLDPIGTAGRWSNTVERRIYSVPCPNSLWHMDAHLKLVRWGFAVHGAIDGYSRLILYLKCTTSMTADTVLNIFVPAIIQHGLPSRVRSDHGYENYFVAALMNLMRGVQRGSHITGTSVHNQRIERLWADVFPQVLSYFYNAFYTMEDESVLNPDNIIHRFALQTVYMQEINNSLETFVAGWNRHRLRTQNRTPRQLWLDGVLINANSNHTSIREIFGDGGEANIHQRVREALPN